MKYINIFGGRFNRLEFLICVMFFFAIYIATIIFPFVGYDIIQWIAVIFIVWIMAKRFQDLNITGWLAVVMFIAMHLLDISQIDPYIIGLIMIIYIIIFICLCVIPGTKDSNKYDKVQKNKRA